VFGIMKQTGGFVRVQSELGRGATFMLYFPRTDRAVDNAPAPPQPHATLRGSETVLVVDDEPQVRQVMSAILAKYGYTVLAAQNAGEALLICEQHPGPIQLLLTDLVMPRLGGRELATRLCAMRPTLRVLLSSGYVDEGAHRGAPDPARPILVKPFSPEQLLRRVRDVLDGDRCAAP